MALNGIAYRQKENLVRLVVFANGWVLVGFSVLMVVVALCFPSDEPVFMASAFVTGVMGAALCLAADTGFEGTRRIHMFLLTATVWLTAATAGALPLYLWQLTPTDAFFEAMSGITTTGSTVMTGLDGTSRGILMWRAILQGLGGVGFIVAGIALLPVMRIGGMALFRTESSDKGDKELTSTVGIARATIQIYLGLNLLCALIYFAEGMSFFDALVHALTTLSTGGYSNYDASFGHFNNAAMDWTASLFMLLGALPFAWYIRGFRRTVFRSEQVTALIGGLSVAIALLVIWLLMTGRTDVVLDLRLVTFNVISVVTTTGYASTDYTEWGPFAVVIFVLLTAMGGCTGSTAGGVKVMRWIILWRVFVLAIRRLQSPSAVGLIRFEGRLITDDVVAEVVALFTLFALSVAGLAFALDLTGLDLETSISAALTSLANVGPGVGPIIGPAGNFAPLNDTAKQIITFGMYIGRLEMMTVFVLMMPRFWREI